MRIEDLPDETSFTMIGMRRPCTMCGGSYISCPAHHLLAEWALKGTTMTLGQLRRIRAAYELSYYDPACEETDRDRDDAARSMRILDTSIINFLEKEVPVDTVLEHKEQVMETIVQHLATATKCRIIGGAR
jgi:hypothetical protein